MRRFALLVVLQWWGILAFSQSPTINGTPQASPHKPSVPLPLFDFNSHQTRHITPSTQFWKMDSLSGLNSENQTSAQGDANQVFHAPPISSSTLLAMMAPHPLVPLPLSLLPNRIWPTAKSEPIPTQWPNAKFEQIPIVWPDLKIQPLAISNSSSVPSK